MSGSADGNRTLPPTQKRIKEFRKRGEIARSKDLVSVATLAGALAGAMFVGSKASRALRELMQLDFGMLAERSAHGLLVQRSISTLLTIVAPIAGGALVGCILATVVQVGWPPAMAPFKFDLTKPFSFSGLGGLVSPKAAAGRAVKSLLKVGFVGGAAAWALGRAWERVAREPSPEASGLLALLSEVGRTMLFAAGGALTLLAIADYIVQRRGMTKKMRMTPDEMRREHREQEGDPAIRRRRRQRMRELARRRLAVVVPKADVVLVNPTEYAVALRYNPEEDGAPRVLAKGRGGAAERIRELARKAGVPIVPEPPLTRLIHKLVPEGREIPAQLFAAVAEVLAYVYRLRGRNT